MKRDILLSVVLGIAIAALSLSPITQAAPSNDLKVVMIRHGEKPETGENLSCQGQDRALKLRTVLYEKFNVPNQIFVPKLKVGEATTHARMFQTISPFAIQHNLSIDSEFDTDDDAGVAKKVLEKTGTVLIVWEHKTLQKIAEKLGIKDPPDWKGSDFDSIWVITYPHGKAKLVRDQEGITPNPACPAN
jgi:hypothetical protein